MQAGLERKKILVLLALIICIQCIVCGYFGHLKQGYFVDEIFSYELANSASAPMMHWEKDLYENWHEGNYFSDYLKVSEDNKFNFDKVYDNQVKDVHPPVYYFLLHIVCSLFSGTFSKWYGIALNILLFVLLQVTLFLLAKEIFKNNRLALIPVIVYGFSPGAISNVIYIRMYLLLTLWVLLFCYFNYLLWYSNEKRAYMGIFLVTFLGFLTQYYFIIFAFFISLSYFVAQLIFKNYKEVVLYVVTMFSSLGLALLYYPAALFHIFGGYRGEEAFNNFAESNSIINFIEFFKIMNTELFAGRIVLFMCILFAITGVKHLIQRYEFIVGKNEKNIVCKKKQVSKNSFDFKITFQSLATVVFIFASVCYMFLIAKVAPYRQDRYIFCIYPLVVLSFCYFVNYVITQYESSKKQYLNIFLLIMLCFSVNGYMAGNVNYLYLEYNDKNEVAMQYQDLNVVYLIKGEYRINEDIQLLDKFQHVYVTKSDGKNIAKDLSRQGITGCVLFITNDYSDIEKMVQDFAETAGMKSEHLFDNRLSKVYRCYV